MKIYTGRCGYTSTLNLAYKKNNKMVLITEDIYRDVIRNHMYIPLKQCADCIFSLYRITNTDCSNYNSEHGIEYKKFRKEC